MGIHIPIISDIAQGIDNNVRRPDGSAATKEADKEFKIALRDAAESAGMSRKDATEIGACSWRFQQRNGADWSLPKEDLLALARNNPQALLNAIHRDKQESGNRMEIASELKQVLHGGTPARYDSSSYQAPPVYTPPPTYQVPPTYTPPPVYTAPPTYKAPPVTPPAVETFKPSAPVSPPSIPNLSGDFRRASPPHTPPPVQAATLKQNSPTVYVTVPPVQNELREKAPGFANTLERVQSENPVRLSNSTPGSGLSASSPAMNGFVGLLQKILGPLMEKLNALFEGTNKLADAGKTDAGRTYGVSSTGDFRTSASVIAGAVVHGPNDKVTAVSLATPEPMAAELDASRNRLNNAPSFNPGMA